MPVTKSFAPSSWVLVKGLGFRVKGLGLRVEGLGLRVEGLGFRALVLVKGFFIKYQNGDL